MCSGVCLSPFGLFHVMLPGRSARAKPALLRSPANAGAVPARERPPVLAFSAVFRAERRRLPAFLRCYFSLVFSLPASRFRVFPAPDTGISLLSSFSSGNKQEILL